MGEAVAQSVKLLLLPREVVSIDSLRSFFRSQAPGGGFFRSSSRGCERNNTIHETLKWQHGDRRGKIHVTPIRSYCWR